MVDSGYSVQVEDVNNLNAIKESHQIPTMLRACHTAIVDGYVIEGHVPVEEVERLLSERPDITGLAVPGMPPGSPGMETGGTGQPYDVVMFDESGQLGVFASYNQ